MSRATLRKRLLDRARWWKRRGSGAMATDAIVELVLSEVAACMKEKPRK